MDSKKEVEQFLEQAKEAINWQQYRILNDRDKNRDLFDTYLFDEEEAKRVLLDLSVEDFSEKVLSRDLDHPGDLLYIFGKEKTMSFRFDEGEKLVRLYIKLNLMANSHLIVVSFHEQEYPLTYKFR